MEAQVQPYTEDVAEEVEAMFERARQAELAQDIRWMEIPSLPPRPFEEEYEASWVVEAEDGGSLLGVVGVQGFRSEEILPPTHPLSKRWKEASGVAELRTLRVAPEARRLGIGAELCRAVLEWARAEQGYRTLIVNTTTPQYPALNLYRKLGFCDVGISYIGRYELVWLEMSVAS